MSATDPFEPLRRIEEDLSARALAPGGPAALNDAVRYALLGGGKRLRPLLAWHACAALGGQGEDALPAAAALEFIHAFSLVHDDLPALDNDDLRRGRPTLHRHAGEAMAILAGDALMTSAFDVLLTSRLAAARGHNEAALRLALLNELVRATNAMISGQVWDSLGGLPSGLDPRAELELIHRNKTGALICAACRMGALCAIGPARDDDPRLGAVTAYGEAIGLMFQIVDDVLDVTQTAEHTGKRTGKDLHAGKKTYPSVLGLEESRAQVERLRESAARALGPLGEKARGLIELCNYLGVRTK